MAVREVDLGGRSVPYRLVRSSRARRVTIRVTADGVTVTAPARVSRDAVERALRADRAWVTEALARAHAATPPPPAAGAGVPFLGERLVLEPGPVRTARREGDRLLLPERAVPAVAAERWYRAEARRHLGGLVDAWAPVIGVVPSRLVIRGQRGRWGSASAGGSISLNWRLMLAPARVGEYVVVHELAHLVHMDHSARFWELVERHWPDHRRDRAWLREHGPSLLSQLRGASPVR